jgi:hypothetical protein
MIQFMNSVLNRFGLQIKRSRSLIMEQQYFQGIIDGATALYKIRESYIPGSLNNKISGLVFSKDRPIQLHALLSTYFKLVANAAPISIIYMASTKKIETYYNELEAEFLTYPVRFIKEEIFYNQVIEWLEIQDADRIFFLTDDALFLEEMDINDCLVFEPIDDIFCFRYGYDLDYSFAFDKSQELPSIKTIKLGNSETFLKWKWNEKSDSPDWVYPISVDGNIFYRLEILSICRNISFKSPNSLESSMQDFVNFFLIRYGISYPKARVINVPCNIVQNEFANRSTGLFTIPELLKFWHDGKRIRVEEFYKLQAKEAMHKKYTFYST